LSTCIKFQIKSISTHTAKKKDGDEKKQIIVNAFLLHTCRRVGLFSNLFEKCAQQFVCYYLAIYLNCFSLHLLTGAIQIIIIAKGIGNKYMKFRNFPAGGKYNRRNRQTQSVDNEQVQQK